MTIESGPASAELRGIAAVAVDEIEALRQVLAVHRDDPQSETLRWLAWPYRDQPGYDPAWAPPDRLTSGH